MLRGRGLLAVVAVVLVVAAAPVWGSSLGQAEGRRMESPERPRVLQIFYSPPVLARAGEPVRIPAEVVCATAGGRTCATRMTLGVRVGVGPWRATSGGPGLRAMFDVTGPAARAVAVSSGTVSSGAVSFVLRARSDSGATISVPASLDGGPLRFYVTGDMPIVQVPAIMFGRTARPETVLFLPWGSGRMRAGIALGNESMTVGPPSFDVTPDGRIYLLDPLQRRLAVFSSERLVRQIALRSGVQADVSVASDGTAYVAYRSGRTVACRAIDPSGRTGLERVVGEGILSQIRTAGSRAFVSLLPLDAWTPVSLGKHRDTLGIGGSRAVTVGRPLGSGAQLLRVATEEHIRLGTVVDGRVSGAIELRSAQNLGELALAEPDGAGGYWAIVHVWRDAPAPADQYQAIHVGSAGRLIRTVALSNRTFADAPPLSRFRLGPDGRLYQLMTSPVGLRIVRYSLGGTS